MKQSIHPTWHHDCAVTCSCGNSFSIGSTQASLVVDICNKCHPFFTGEMRFVDRQGRVDKFMKKMQNAQGASTKKKAKKAGKIDTAAEAERKSYQDILRQQQAQIKQSTPKESDSAPAAN